MNYESNSRQIYFILRLKYSPKSFKIPSGISRKINQKIALHLIVHHSIFYERKSIGENENITCFETV